MLDLTFDVKPDEHGVYNGVELAEQLIGSAVVLLSPYINSCGGCGGCLDDLFGRIANIALATAHKYKETHGSFQEEFLGDAKVRDLHIATYLPMIKHILEGEDGEHTEH